MSLTPERRVTPPGHGLSVHNLVNSIGGVQDRFVPSLRVEPASDRSQSSLSTQSLTSLASSSNRGNVLGDGMYSTIATISVKTGVGMMIALSLSIMMLGENFILNLSQFLGFILFFVFVFCVSCGGYLWWISWVHEAVKLNVHSSLMLLLTCFSSEIISSLANQMVDLGPFEALPIDISFYTVHTASLFCLFACLVHQKGMSAILSNETCIFVTLTVVMHYSCATLFSTILPSMLYCQIVYGSCFLAMCISLMLLKHQPSISLVSLRRIIRASVHSKKDMMPASYAGRRFSNVSLMSNLSSIRPRNSITDQSSLSGFQDALDSDGLTEANGMIGDLLFQEESLSQRGRESLKKIRQLLSIKFPSSTINHYIPRSRLDSGESDVASGVSYTPPRRVSFSQKRHQSSQFTTTTTSTGLPNVETDPQERRRSVAMRDKARMSVVDGKRPSVHRFPSQLATRYKKSMPNLSRPFSYDVIDGRTTSSEVSSPESSFVVSEDDSPPITIKRLQSRTDSLDVIAEDDREGKRSNQTAKRVSSETETDVFVSGPKTTLDSPSVGVSDHQVAKPGRVLLHFNEFTEPPVASVDMYEKSGIDILDQVVNWDFPIFELEEASNGNILSQMAFCLFKEAGLMETFNIPHLEFINYFRSLEANYGTKTYHNKTHAADVLHATSYLLFEEIPEFSHYSSDPIEGERQWVGNLRSKVSAGNIASAFSILEVLACYMAAAMHDFDHPGRTNAFLVATRDPLAVLYNDRSVLENHHVAASWDLLVSDPKRNFLTNLEKSEMKRLRFLIIECILATDLKHHFSIVGEFRDKCVPEAEGIDWSSDIDRLQVMKMVIKMADINTPTKCLELHRAWTVRITEEFYQQHDDEIRLGLPQTIFMNRNETEKLPAIQVSFIQNLVVPLFRACAEVGIIPGEAEPVVSSSKNTGELTDEETSSDIVLTDDDSIPGDADELIRPTKNIFSIILTNLQTNYESWKDELPVESEDKTDDS